MSHFVQNDGGRAAVGFKGETRDCVARAIAIAASLPYADVYRALAAGNAAQRKGKAKRSGRRTAREGIHTQREWFKRYMASLGFRWVPTMKIGAGCTVHLRADELPGGRLVVAVSRHMVAMIDGVIHDTHDPARNGTRCVYGYWQQVAA